MNGHLTDLVKTSVVLNAVAAGTTNQNGTSVDQSGFDGVRFTLCLGTLTATQVTRLQIQGSTDNSTFSDITAAVSANAADGDGNKLLIVDVLRPSQRYLRPVAIRGTANAVINQITAEQYRLRAAPTSAAASVSNQVKVSAAV